MLSILVSKTNRKNNETVRESLCYFDKKDDNWKCSLDLISHQVGHHRALVVLVMLLALLTLVFIDCIRFHCFLE
jgi:hypothetical protein